MIILLVSLYPFKDNGFATIRLLPIKTPALNAEMLIGIIAKLITRNEVAKPLSLKG
jgi:hypothetical protein